MAKEKEAKFEDKIKELESIINELENGEIDIDTSIEKYTKVNKIVKDNGDLEDFHLAKD